MEEVVEKKVEVVERDGGRGRKEGGRSRKESGSVRMGGWKCFKKEKVQVFEWDGRSGRERWKCSKGMVKVFRKTMMVEVFEKIPKNGKSSTTKCKQTQQKHTFIPLFTSLLSFHHLGLTHSVPQLPEKTFRGPLPSA